MKNLLTALVICSSFGAFAQQNRIDSLLVTLKNSNKVQKLDVLKDICEYYKTNSHELGFRYADSLYLLASELDNQKSITRALSYRGVFNPNREEGILDLERAITIDSTLGLSYDRARDKLNLSSLYKLTNNIDRSISLLEEVIPFSEEHEHYDLYLKATYNMAMIYLQGADYESGLRYCQMALKHFDKSEDYNTQTRVYALISKIYSHFRNHKKSLEYGLLGLDMIDNHEIGLLVQSLVYHELCETNLNLGNEQEGFKYYIQTIEASKTSFDYHGLINALWVMSIYINDNEVLNDAIVTRVLDDAQEIAGISNQINDTQSYYSIQLIRAQLQFLSNKLDVSKRTASQIIDDYRSKPEIDIETIEQSLYLLEKINIREDRYKDAYGNASRRHILRDSLNAQNYHQQLSSLEVQFQTEKKEKENLQLRTEKAEQELRAADANRQKWIFAMALLGAVITLIVFTVYYRRNKKQKNIIEGLQKELHHRVKNNLSIIDTFIEVAKEEFDDVRFSQKLSEIQNRIESINEVHMQLYHSKDITSVNVKKYIDALSDNVRSSYGNSTVSIRKNIPDSMILEPTMTFPLGLMINEFLTNSFKYAFGDTGGEIRIELKDDGSHVQVSLSDNGKGLPENFDILQSETFGIRFIKLLSEQLSGSCTIANNNGVSLEVIFPK